MNKKKSEVEFNYSAIDQEAINGWLDALWQTKGFIDWVKQRDFNLLKTLGTLLPPESYHCYIGRRAELLDLAVEAKRRFVRQQEAQQKKKNRVVVVKTDHEREDPLTMA